MKKVVIVLPTLNEKHNLERFVEEVLDQEKNLPGYEVEVVISDSSSTDGTAEIAKKLSLKNPKVHFISVGSGLGVGLIEGHKYALENLHPDILAQIDADGQVEVDVLIRLVKTIEQGFNLALGSRFVPGGKNKLSLSRRIFSLGASLVFRALVGPWSVREVTNSARAFTPELFKKINLGRLPWREKTFIIQPAFLNEAILAGAKFKEVPLVFKNRAEGYSKNKTLNYTYDVVTYSIDARLKKWGIDFPFFYYTRRAKTIVKFALVGFSGTVVDFLFYNLFIVYLGLMPATSKGLSTEIAILNNFSWNNIWTFRWRRTKTNIWQKLGIFNLVSLGGLAIGVVIVKFLHTVYGDGIVRFLFLDIPYYNIYFFVTIPPVLTWNFTMNHFVTWKHQRD